MSRAAPRIAGVVDWSGDVELDGDCIIAPTAILRLKPGCRLSSPPGGAPARLIVQGTLVVAGRPWRPAVLDAAVRAAGGWVQLSHCRIQGGGAEGVHLYGDGHRLDRVSISGFSTGLFVRDGQASARRLSISDCPTAVDVSAGGRLRWEGGSVLSARGSPMPRILAHGELSGASLTLEASLAAAGGRVDLSDCRLNGRGGEGLNLYGAGHRLERVHLDGFETGLVLHKGEALATGLQVTGGKSPVVVGLGGKLVWEGGGVSSADAAPLVLVQGELVARGTRERELTFGASIAADGGRVELEDCGLTGRGGEGLMLRGGGQLLRGVSLTGFEQALSVRGGETRARGLTIAGERTGVVIGEDGRLDWEGGAIAATGGEQARITVKGAFTGRGAPDNPLSLDATLALAGGTARLASFGLVGEDGEELALEALTIAGCGAGLACAREGRLGWAGDGAPPGRTIITVKGEFTARGAGRAFALDASLAAEGGRVELANCRLEARGGEGLTLRGGGHLVERVTLTGFACGLSLRGGEARARELNVRRCETAVIVGPDGLLVWDGGGARDGGLGALISGGQARLLGLRFTALRRGARVEDGAAEIDGLDCRELAGPAVELQGGGFVSVRGGRAPSGEILVAAAGHAHLAGPCEGGVRASASALLCVSPAAVARERVGALRSFVMATGARPLGGGIYKAAGAASVRLFASWAARQPEVSGAWVHRSWVAGGWEPGASDIDLALSVRELSSPSARKWLERAQSLHAGARRLFPALGELLIAEESDWRGAASAGLPRPGEWRSQARVLTGRLPDVPPPAPSNARLGARLEAAMAYSRLMDVCFRPEMAEELSRREAAKAVVDLLRYLSPEGERGRAPSREEFRAGLASSSPDWAERLRALSVPGRAHRAACALAAAGARHWGAAGPSSGTARAPRKISDGGSASFRRAFETVDEARGHFDGAVFGAVFDTLHRSYLVVEQDCPEDSLAEGIAAWARRNAACAARPPLPIVLTRGGWPLWRATAYQDFPSASAAWPGPDDSPLESAGRDFPGECRVFWGDYLSAPPSIEEAAAGLAQARAQFRLVRSLLVREALGSRAAAHHLLTRAACLALAARGLPAPDFDLDAALAAAERLTPGAASGLRRAASGDWSAFDAAVDELLSSGVPTAAAPGR